MYIRTSMKQAYRLNQVQEAICRTLDAQDSREGELKLRLKRLLVTDRRLGRRQKGGDQRFAFYSAAAPGSGVEVRFSGYEAFALLAAVAMLEHGFPQARVVRALTEVRNQLEHAHAEILAKDPHELFDENTINARAKSGTLATGSTDEVFLVIATFPSLAQQKTAVRICRGQAEYMDFLLRQSPTGTTSTAIPFSRLMLRLAENISQAQPARRGPAARA
jgi:hypothetical protein